MKLTESNLIIQSHKSGFCMAIMMPDGSRNYLHTDLQMSINDVIVCRDLLLGQEFYNQDIDIKQDESYFRLHVNLKDPNGTEYEFHSRKLNLNDVVFERMQLVNADE